MQGTIECLLGWAGAIMILVSPLPIRFSRQVVVLSPLNYLCSDVFTVDTLLTHTARWTAQAMGYEGLWD